MANTSCRPISPNTERWKPAEDPSTIVIPGLDTDASTTDQIEQIEQLITIKLQNIDENFSKIHEILANNLLPAVKRYAVGTEPIREAAKFWTSFYEQAAQIRIPTFDDDYSTVNEMPSEREDRHASEEVISEQEETVNQLTNATFESNVIGSENSFLPSQAAFASTPARHGTVQDSFSTQSSNDRPSVLQVTPPSRRNRRPASNRPTTPLVVDDDDDSFIGLIPGMSPLVTMSPARPPRSSAELGLLKVGQTPAKEASTRIKRDLLRDAQIRSAGQKSGLFSFDGGDSKSSTLPTPPSFSRYTRNFDYSTSRSITKDSGLESMILHFRSDLEPTAGVSKTPSLVSTSGQGLATTSGLATTPGLPLRPRTQALSTVEPRGEKSHQATPVYENMLQDMDSDSDSADEVNNTAYPSAAFIMASQGSHPYDDSFDSSNHSDDSLNEDVGAGLVPIHPFANAVEDDDFDDDSFDGFARAGGDFQEETVFGVAPGERERTHAEGLRMMGQELLEDTIGMGAQIVAGAEDSPTPTSWVR